MRNAGGLVVSNDAILALSTGLHGAVLAGQPDTAGTSDGVGRLARFDGPFALALDDSGNIVVADARNQVIRRVQPNGNVTTLAGIAGAPGFADGPASAARFSSPAGVTIDGSGNIYVADLGNEVIRKISPTGNVSTVAGVVGSPGSTDGERGAARFSRPLALVAASDGTLFVGDQGNSTIRMISPAGVVTTLAGKAGARGSADGTAGGAQFGQIEGVARDRVGNLYISEYDNRSVRKVTPSGVVTTIYQGQQVALRPHGVAIDATGTLYLAYEAGASSGLARITPDGGILSWGPAEVYGDITATSLNSSMITGIVRDSSGTIYLSDVMRNAILKVMEIPGDTDAKITVLTSPASHMMAEGDSVLLEVVASGPSLAYQWAKDGVPINNATAASLLLRKPNATNAGRYTVTVRNPIGSVTSLPAQVSMTPTNNVGRLSNLSIRSLSSDAQPLIVGVVIDGNQGPNGKSVLVRGIGPTLASFGVSGAMIDPRLLVISGARILAENDNWGVTPALGLAFQDVGAFALPSNSLDAAVQRSFPSGSYTVQISGTDGATGVVLAEIYDSSKGNVAVGGARLVNLSARTDVGVGSNILIAGFVIGGSTSKTVLIRAVGPGLEPFHITGVLADPQLELFKGSTRIAGNDSWNDGEPTLSEAFKVTGAFPAAPLDAAILVTLAPGTYSVQVSGRGYTTGTALVEIYEYP